MKKTKETQAREDARPTTDGADTAALELAALPSLEKQTVQHVLTVNIVPSPFQPRKEFPAEEMEDLATSVRANGIRIPLLGRRPDPDEETVELVAGERRWRTAKSLNLEAVPMIVQPLTDEEVIRIQRVENAGRENLKALEAAEDYLLLQGQGKTVEEICALHGVKRSHVFTRLRVAKLPAEIKQLVKDGKLSITVADLIAKLPTEEMQNEVTIRACKSDYYGDVPSFRQMQETIAEEYTRNLSGAAWLKGKSSDVDLIEGVNPCATCPKRSGNMEDAEGSANVCTDVKCFAAKEAAHTKRLIATAQERSQSVIKPEDYQRKSYEFEVPEDHCNQDEKERTWGALAKAAKIEPAVTVSAGKLLEVFTREQQAAILTANKIKRPDQARENVVDKAKQEAERQAIEAAITEAILSSGRDLDDVTAPALMVLLRRLTRTVVMLFEYDLSAALFKGRGLKHTSNQEKDWATIHGYIDQQTSGHNLVGLMVELMLRRKVTRYSPEALTIWGVNWTTFLPGAKSPAKGAKEAKKTKAKVPPAKTQKPTKGKATKATAAVKARRSQTAATGKKGGRK